MTENETREGEVEVEVVNEKEKDCSRALEIQQIINGLNQLGQQIQATQAAVLRAQVRTQVFEDRIMDIAVEVRELRKKVLSDDKA